MDIKNNRQMMKEVLENVEKVIIGKREAIELVLCSFLCGGHVLIEDMPGVGKTSLVSAVAKSFDCSFKRIQFTPDILPSDITGFSIYKQNTGEFEYYPGAIMSQIILADEINRTSPKTQSSLLEVMEENQVTVDGTTYQTPTPFIVFATQNPIEYLGTYPLPEAQLDRFFMRISLGYPTMEQESKMLSRFKEENPVKSLKPVATTKDLISAQEEVKKINVDESINNYIVSIVNKTRYNDNIDLGASPRASISLYKAAQAMALYQNRDYVIPDDVIKMTIPILEHRIVLKQETKLKKLKVKDILENILKSVKVPL
ncbi:MAG: MoxR family ATPase [Defluviitaleaceae bacterium]|nr:MoxR family ATPase [Defluviitaleaceae bacterium]